MSKSPIVRRQMASAVSKALRQFPVVSITGPRQSGKTTLAHLAAPGYRYLNMEIDEHKFFAVRDPNGFLKQYDYKVILDEVQAVPSLFPYLQQHTDRLNKNGAYMLSGSQNFLLMEKMSQTLAGRVAVFSLLPFSINELSSYLHGRQMDWASMCIKGFYPRLFREKINPALFYNSYIKTYVEKDVRTLLNIHSTQAFTQFIKLCAIRVGSILNSQDIARAIGVDNKTVNSWIGVLEASYVLYRLPPFYNNLDKRIIKKPKIYFVDTGILCYLLGIKNAAQLLKHPNAGGIFENLVINEKLKGYYNRGISPSSFFWQDSNGREVDFIIDDGTRLLLHEIKSSSTPRPDYFKNIDLFSKMVKEQGIKVKKHLVYGGDDSYKVGDVQVQSWQVI